MAFTKEMMLELMKSGAQGENPYVQGQQARLTSAQGAQQEDRAARLKDYLQGQATQKNIESTKDLESDFMLHHPGFKGTFRVGPGGAEISENQAVVNPKMLLTPAQEEAEKKSGDKIQSYEQGGKQAMDSNIGQINSVQNDLSAGGRDKYDRVVGGALENHPTLMAFLAPAEKARRDRVQNAMLGMLHEAGIPRPTQWDIQRVFGQVYDPASDDQSNAQRLTSAVGKMQAQKQSTQDAADSYHRTGYATMGGAGRPASPQAPGAPAAPSNDDSDISAALERKKNAALKQQSGGQ